MRKIVALVALAMIGGCSMVGTRVPPGTAGICHKKFPPCVAEYKEGSVGWEIENLGNGKHRVTGKLDKSGVESLRKTSFTVYLIKNDVVVGEIGAIGENKKNIGTVFTCTFDNIDFDESSVSFAYYDYL